MDLPWFRTSPRPRRRVRALAVWLGVALGAWTGWLMAAPPNIVVFLSDDHGQRDSTPYGARDVRTPNMQALADAGLVFDRAFVASPACAPSRAALLTGLMPARNGAEANHTYKRDDVESLPPRLRALGYEVVAFGKVAHGPDAPRHGFDHWEKRSDAARVGRFLRQRDPGRPLCLFVGTRQPHVPWAPNAGYDPARVTLPPKFIDTPETRDHRCRYYTDVSIADRELGEIRRLAKRAFGRNLVFCYTSDHGAQWPFGKWNLYDAGMAVPFIVEWPGVVRPGTRTDAMISWVDLLPTLIEIGGGHPPAGIDGRSFLKVLRGETDHHRERIFTTHTGDGRMNVYPIRALRTERWKYIWNLHPEFGHSNHSDLLRKPGAGAYWDSWEAAAARDPKAAAIVRSYRQRPADELYDLRRDPWEQHNLAADPAYAGKVRALHAAVEAWMERQGDTRLVNAEPRLLSDPEAFLPQRPVAGP